MRLRSTRRATLAAIFVLGLPAVGSAQGLDLTINHVGLGIGYPSGARVLPLLNWHR